MKLPKIEQPAVVGEREAFEAWWAATFNRASVKHYAWSAWQARAAREPVGTVACAWQGGTVGVMNQQGQSLPVGTKLYAAPLPAPAPAAPEQLRRETCPMPENCTRHACAPGTGCWSTGEPCRTEQDCTQMPWCRINDACQRELSKDMGIPLPAPAPVRTSVADQLLRLSRRIALIAGNNNPSTHRGWSDEVLALANALRAVGVAKQKDGGGK